VALLLAEGSMLYGLQHQNLLPVLAVALPKPRGPPMLVYPLMGHGNLKRSAPKSKNKFKNVFLTSCYSKNEFWISWENVFANNFGRRFLQNCRLRGSNGDLKPKEEIEVVTDDEDGQSSLMTQDLVHMALQVVLALMYLQGHKLSHRDVATRNCV